MIGEYASFIRGFLKTADPTLNAFVQSELNSGALWREPWISLSPAFAPGGSIDDLVGVGLLNACSTVTSARQSRPRSRAAARAAHFVQRRRADIEHYLGDTPFPQRLDAEASYTLHPEYRDPDAAGSGLRAGDCG